MHTNEIAPEATTDDTQTTPAVRKPAWPRWAVRILASLRKATRTTRDFITADPTGAATLLGTAVAVLLTLLLTFSALVTVVRWLTSGHVNHDVATALPVARIATDPIGHWLAAHTAGLPLTASTAAWTWGVAGFVLFYSASYRHTGAQLLWPLYGTATAAMAWSGTATTAHRPIAAGLIAVAWIALSLLALRGRRQPRTARS